MAYRGEITEDDLPGPNQFRLVLSRNWPGPGKSSSGVTKSWKMTYLGLANSGLWQAGICLSPVSHLAKSEKMIWWNQLSKVIFRGQAIPACRKPELVRPWYVIFRGRKNRGKWLWLDKVISEILKGAQVWKFSSHGFFDFYTIKPLWVGDFRAKIKNSKF